MPTLADAPFVDFFSEEFQADPTAVIGSLRDQTWLVQTPIGGMVIRREEVGVLLADRRLRSSVGDLARMQGVTEGTLAERLTTSILALDGDDHLRIRRLANRAFTPRAVDRHRGDMRSTLTALLDPVAPEGRADFVDAIAEHYPIQVMCHILGVPDEDHEQFAEWNKSITWALSLSLAEHLAEVEEAFGHLDAYITELIADRRAQPRDDLVTTMIQAREADDRLSDDEVAGMIGALLFAGYDTTRNQLGLGMWLFAQFPDQWNQLRADPSLAQPAVEEVMRHAGAVSGIPRFTVEDIELNGWTVPAGTMLSLGTASANHDPAAYDRPEEFDITAEREPHFTFGGGPHYCLGASLARAEMQEAFPLLADAMPDLALDGEPTWRPPMGIYGPDSLPLRWTVSR